VLAAHAVHGSSSSVAASPAIAAARGTALTAIRSDRRQLTLPLFPAAAELPAPVVLPPQTTTMQDYAREVAAERKTEATKDKVE
jgi:hypothetical protein